MKLNYKRTLPFSLAVKKEFYEPQTTEQRERHEQGEKRPYKPSRVSRLKIYSGHSLSDEEVKITPAGSTGPSPSSPLVWSDLQRTLLFSLAVKEKFHEPRTTGTARKRREETLQTFALFACFAVKIYKGHSLFSYTTSHRVLP